MATIFCTSKLAYPSLSSEGGCGRSVAPFSGLTRTTEKLESNVSGGNVVGKAGTSDSLLRRNAEVLLVRKEIRETGAFVQERAESDLATRLDVGLVILDVVDVSEAVRGERRVAVVLVNDGRIAACRQCSRSLPE